MLLYLESIKCSNLSSTLLLQNIYTDSDLTDPRVHERLMQDVSRLEKSALTLDKRLPKGSMLMIDVFYENSQDQSNLRTEYYLADHSGKTVFFLQFYNAGDMKSTYEVNGPKSYQHLGTCHNLLNNTSNPWLFYNRFWITMPILVSFNASATIKFEL